MFCAHCGNEVEQHAKFCSRCGREAVPALKPRTGHDMNMHINILAWLFIGSGILSEGQQYYKARAASTMA